MTIRRNQAEELLMWEPPFALPRSFWTFSKHRNTHLPVWLSRLSWDSVTTRKKLESKYHETWRNNERGRELCELKTGSGRLFGMKASLYD